MARTTRRKKQEIEALVVILVILLGLRAFGQVLNLIFAGSLFFGFSHLVFGSLYVAAIIGVVERKKWGASIAIILAVIDAILSVLTGGLFSGGALVVDLLILLLAAQQLKLLNGSKRK